MNGPLKTATLKDGTARIFYDSVTKIEETHSPAGLKKTTLYQFVRGSVGIVAVIPAERIEKLEA